METSLTVTDNQNLVDDKLSELKKFANGWLEFNKGKTAATLKTYEKVLKIFFKWMSANGVTEITYESVQYFLNSLERKSDKTGKLISPRTRRLYRATLIVFVKFLVDQEVIVKDFTHKIAKIKGIQDNEQHERQALSTQQAKQLLKVAMDKAKSGKVEDARNAAICGILLSCGLRAVEISRLTLEDYHGNSIDVTGKGSHGAKKSVKVPSQTRKLIDAYLKIRKGDSDGNAPLFLNLSKRGAKDRLKNTDKEIKGIQSQTVSGIVKRMLVAAGIISDEMKTIEFINATGENKKIRRRVDSNYYKLSCHSTRHFTGCEMLRQKVNVEWVRQVLRHSNISVTSIYIKDLDRESNDGTDQVAMSLFD